MLRNILICLLLVGAVKAGCAAVDSIGQASAPRLVSLESVE